MILVESLIGIADISLNIIEYILTIGLDLLIFIFLNHSRLLYLPFIIIHK
jgi:hypothetical protein